MMRPRTRLVAIHPVHGYPIPPPQDVKVSRRNARERSRVKTVNNGFEVLKKHIPTAAPVKKLSKVGILSHAVEYIRNLQMMLDAEDGIETGLEDIKSTKWAPVVKSEPIVEYVQHPPPSCTPGYSEPPVYPPPLTPISPNTMYYPTPASTPSTYYTQRHYESGYETSLGLYSETEYMVPQPLKHPLTSPQQLVNSPLPLNLPSPTSTISEVTYPLPLKRRKMDPDSSGEEDDLLDAIVEWQQSEL